MRSPGRSQWSSTHGLHDLQEQRHQDALAALCLEHTAALDAAAQEAAERTAQAEAEHAAMHLQQQQDALAALEKAWQQEQKQQAANFASEMTSLKQLHEQSLHDICSQHNLQLRQFQAELTQAHQIQLASALSRLAEEHQAELGRQQQLSQRTAVEAADSLGELRAQQERELHHLQAEHANLVQELQNEHQQSKSQQRQAFTDQMQELQERLGHKHASELSQAHERAAALCSMHAEQDAHTEKLQQQLNKAQERLNMADAEHKQELAIVTAHHQVCCSNRSFLCSAVSRESCSLMNAPQSCSIPLCPVVPLWLAYEAHLLCLKQPPFQWLLFDLKQLRNCSCCCHSNSTSH